MTTTKKAYSLGGISFLLLATVLAIIAAVAAGGITLALAVIGAGVTGVWGLSCFILALFRPSRPVSTSEALGLVLEIPVEFIFLSL